MRPQGHGVVRTWTWSCVRKRRSGAARWRRWVRTSSPLAPSSVIDGGAGFGIDQLDVDDAPRADVHAVLLLALAEERHADVADAHRLRDLRAPTGFQPRPERLLAATGLAGHQHALDARAREVDAALPASSTRWAAYEGVSTAASGRRRSIAVQQPLRVAGAEGDVAQPDAVEGGERGAGGERPGVVRRDDPLSGRDA